MTTLLFMAERRESVAVFRLLPAHLDETRVADLEVAVLSSLNESGLNDAALDLSSVRYLASPALGALLALRKELRRRGGRLVLAGLTEEVRSMFALTRLTTLFRICPSVEAAVYSLEAELRPA